MGSLFLADCHPHSKVFPHIPKKLPVYLLIEYTPEYHWPSWQQGHIESSWLTCPPGLPDPSLQRSFTVGQPLTCNSEWDYSSHGAGHYTDLCWTSLSSSLPSNLDLTEWQHMLLVYQPLLSVLYQQQTCWGSSLPLYPSPWCMNELDWTSGERSL